uniref:hypothetical protein n=1 Tax=Petrachloros mirabilis TaxID=2918835 RepID=UPI001EE82752|nr:hypothetical protein [Petrachloros mirabilis]
MSSRIRIKHCLLPLHGLLASAVMLTATQGSAAEYQGRNIDGQRLPGTVYSYETGGVFDVEVVFQENRATLYFVNGSEKTVRLRNPVITNPKRIEGFKRGFVTLGNIFSLGVADHHVGNLQPPHPRPFEGFWRIQLSEEALADVD